MTDAPLWDRRRFLSRASGALAGAALPLVGSSTVGSGRATEAYDLVITGGRVIDPGQDLDAVRDVAIEGARVAAVGEGLSTDDARRVLDASGKIVTPGLVDAHVHVYDGVALYGVPPDVVGVSKGVTTLVDGGSAGATTFPGFREYVARPSRTRVRALLNISSPGMTVPNELADLRWVDPGAAVQTVEDNRDVVVGLKVRMLSGIPGGGDLEVMRRTREAAEAADVPIMVHIGGHTSPLPRILELLRPGDVVTHALRARGSILDESGRIFPEVRDARARGVLFDVGHGRGNLDFDTAEAVLAQGMAPDLISSDVHRGNVVGPVFGLPTTLSKFLAMGMSLGDVIAAATSTPSRAFPSEPPTGSLRPGSVADVSVLELVDGDYTLVDSGGQRRRAGRRLVSYATLVAGREYGAITG